jgi:hypothetical protein
LFSREEKQNRNTVTVSEKLMSQEKDSQNSQNKEALMNLGAWLGRHQASV